MYYLDKIRICPCWTLLPSPSSAVHIIYPCRTILCSLFTDKPCSAIYPQTLQVAVPSIFNRCQHMVCRTILRSLFTDKPCSAIYPQTLQVAVRSIFNRCQHMVCRTTSRSLFTDKPCNAIYLHTLQIAVWIFFQIVQNWQSYVPCYWI